MDDEWESPVRRRLRESQPVFGCTITSTSLDLAARAAASGFHFLWLELEHSPLTLETVRHIVLATREPANAGLPDLAPLIEFGASPRATIALAQASRAHAFLRGRAFVTPDDVKAIAPDVLRHRVLTTYEAEAEDVTSEQIVQRVLAKIESP